MNYFKLALSDFTNSFYGVFTKIMNIKPQQRESNRKHTHLVSCEKVDQNSSPSQYVDTKLIISLSFQNCFTYFQLKGLFKINFKLPCISVYANLVAFYKDGMKKTFFLLVFSFVSFSQFHFSYFAYI